MHTSEGTVSLVETYLSLFTMGDHSSRKKTSFLVYELIFKKANLKGKNLLKAFGWPRD